MPIRNFFLIIKIKEQEEIVNVNDDKKKKLNEEISLQNDKCDDSIDLDEVDQTI